MIRSSLGRPCAGTHSPYTDYLPSEPVSTLAAIAALPACTVAIRLLFATALRRLLVAIPSSERWHDTPTPLFGGVGIFAGLTAGIWLAAAIGAMPVTHQLAGIYGGISILFVAGLVDDLYALS